MLTAEIKSKVQTLWDRLWAGGLSNPIEAIEQISYLLFMKRLEVFRPEIANELKWSVYTKFEEKKLTSHIKNVVFAFIKNKLGEENDPFAVAMDDAVFKINSSSLLKDAILYIDDIYKEIDEEIENKKHYFQDIQGDVYEHLLQQTSEAGKNGQFRTPRHIISMMAEILDPDIDGKICDITSGSGGFLVGAYQYLISKYSDNKEINDDGLLRGVDGRKLDVEKRRILEENTFYGFDLDYTMVRIGVMNLMMHGITIPNIVHVDSLSNDYEEIEINRLKLKKEVLLNDKKIEGIYKYILANPPFTGKVDSKRISDNLDRIYPPKLDENSNRKSITVQSELLFLERIIYMLQEGGKACVIVPEGVLFNSGKTHQSIRKLLLTDCTLEGVISLPSGTFLPYTGVKTSILIFQKRKLRNPENELQSVDVWFYGMQSDGYTLDNARRRKIDTPLLDTIEQWKERKSSNQTDRKLEHFNVPISEIIENDYELNFNLYKEFIYESQDFESTTSLLEKLKKLEVEISNGLSELNNL
ncbi:N-6 DNA methylase [Pedobacter foliorum]|uniref:class I SAM-dependent DNA methyltransferase n=1 Tax=Pedobacter foliorum TaxID=2739058 RepID=UPI0015660DBF|nr:N-6 DNA methylase [Pedobacter foliorum]NRF40222.1 N-6 DNA methylase [Pedobacter foliorum]